MFILLEELKKLRQLVIDAKERDLKVVSTLVKKMLEKNIFLFGFLDTNEGSKVKVNELTELQNARIQVACKKLFADSKIEDLIHMDVGKEFDLNKIKKLSTDCADLKKIAMNEGIKTVNDNEDAKGISGNKELIGDAMENIVKEWDSRREMFYCKTGLEKRQLQVQEDDESFGMELEQILSGT